MAARKDTEHWRWSASRARFRLPACPTLRFSIRPAESFIDVTPTAHGRWYPTVTELNDGRMMTTSGLNDTDGITTTPAKSGTVSNGALRFRAIPTSRTFRHFNSRCIPECTCFRPATSSIRRRHPPLLTSILPTRPGRWLRGRFIPARTIRTESEPTAHPYCFRSRRKITTAPKS